MKTPERKQEPDTVWIKPIVKENLSDVAYAALREALMRGHLKPGDQLPLRPTSARFGISLTPMREALTRLVVERALTLDARGTVTVPQLTQDQLLEIRSIRLDLEGCCAALAAETASQDEVDALETLQTEMDAAQNSGDFKTAIDINTQFHLRLCKLANRPITYEIVEGLWVRIGPILTHLYDTARPDNWTPHPHVRVISGLRARDPDATRQALAYDIENGGQGLLNYVAE